MEQDAENAFILSCSDNFILHFAFNSSCPPDERGNSGVGEKWVSKKNGKRKILKNGSRQKQRLGLM
jgi:hypothetical protein